MSNTYKHNGLDKVEYVEGDDDIVTFYINEQERERDLYAVLLRVDNEGSVKVSSSMALPTRGWLDYAYAYRRVTDFMIQNNLREAVNPST